MRIGQLQQRGAPLPELDVVRREGGGRRFGGPSLVVRLPLPLLGVDLLELGAGDAGVQGRGVPVGGQPKINKINKQIVRDAGVQDRGRGVTVGDQSVWYEILYLMRHSEE